MVAERRLGEYGIDGGRCRFASSASHTIEEGAGVTVLICLGPTPDTWWQVRNSLGWSLLDRAAQAAPDEGVREAIVVSSAVQNLDLHGMESPLREQVWQAVEETARLVASESPGPPPLWPAEWLAHVGELAREMEARRLDRDRPGVW